MLVLMTALLVMIVILLAAILWRLHEGIDLVSRSLCFGIDLNAECHLRLYGLIKAAIAAEMADNGAAESIAPAAAEVGDNQG